jgi:hypothetical protein
MKKNNNNTGTAFSSKLIIDVVVFKAEQVLETQEISKDYKGEIKRALMFHLPDQNSSKNPLSHQT